MTRGAPDKWTQIRLPDRDLRIAATAKCPHCSEQVPTRHGRLAGHYYGPGSTLCPGTNSEAAA